MGQSSVLIVCDNFLPKYVWSRDDTAKTNAELEVVKIVLDLNFRLSCLSLKTVCYDKNVTEKYCNFHLLYSTA